MAFQFPEGLAPEVYPLAWLVGSWRGPGFLGYEDIPERPIVVEATFGHDGGPYLNYTATTWLLAGEIDGLETTVDQADLVAGDVWSVESGYWRVAPAAPEDARELTGEGDPARTPVTQLEVLLAEPTGHVSVYLGAVAGPRVDLATDLVARTRTGADITAAKRMYGLVGGELMWATDLAAFGHEMASYSSGRLQRMS
ncbi:MULTISPECIES: FABP family protein [unclassified Pseudactinotalea]|uniref:FABP family protein n=1 Tax=unclassified Pseudactinotalea TaxID=2649176 RepID=UPI00128E6014|nr:MULTISPECIES: FABP family protein [unclassified Pseudactinotalea]MPV50431.1 DUF1794 domain-containing protein [Pseudactinotalea sp. HY160]QGH70541.1 DUF1794 domain-containing protein [Pseudactinotalea sp. HY158]